MLLNIKYDESAGLPTSMCLKGGFDPTMRELLWRAYVNEARFFAVIAPKIRAPLPTSYYAGWDVDRRQGLVLMEDLTASGCTFVDPSNAVTPDLVAQGLRIQAEIHAQWWGTEPGGALEWLSVGSQPIKDYIEMITTPANFQHLIGMRGDLVSTELRDGDRLVRAVRKLWSANETPPFTFNHGDTNLSNTCLTATGELRFRDFQSVSLGNWAADVTAILVGGLDVEDRRAHERALLEGYLDLLASFGGPRLDSDEAWTNYRRNVIQGVFYMLTPTKSQPEETSRAMTVRFGTAADDLETLEALGVS